MAVHVIPTRVQHLAIVQHHRVPLMGFMEGDGAWIGPIRLGARERVSGAWPATAELLDWLPLFGLRLVRNFLDSGQMTDRFYALLMFLHIGIPLVLLLGMWLHIQRVVAADVHPRRALA